MIKPELFLKKGLVYPKANHSFKTNGVIGMTYMWDKDYVGQNGTKGCYVQTPEKGEDEDIYDEEFYEDGDEEDWEEYDDEQ